MSDHDLLERIQKQMDRMADKLDEVLTVVSDIKANEKLNEERHGVSDKRHDSHDRRIDEVNDKSIARCKELERTVKELESKAEDKFATKESVAPIKRIMWGIGSVVGTLLLTAIVGLVLIKNPSTIIQKPTVQQQTEQPK